MAKLSGFAEHFLYSASNAPTIHYRKFKVEKRSGGFRQIDEPLPDLKCFQRWLVREFFARFPASKFSHAYKRSHSIKTNARLHLSKSIVLRVDVKDFFASLRIGLLVKMLEQYGYTAQVSGLISNLCFLEGALPQGAPTSAIISNLLLADIDKKIGADALAAGLHFTRYADDLAFSGSRLPRDFIQKVSKHLKLAGLELNSSKTRIMGKGARQIVCGTILNEKIGAPRKFRRLFRQEVHYIRTFGLEGHLSHQGETRRQYLDTLIGRGNHILWMSEHAPLRFPEVRKDVEFIKRLKRKEETS